MARRALKQRHRLGALGLVAALQLPSTAGAIDLLESYRAALAEDAEFRAAQAQAEANREVLPMAEAQLYPNVSSNYSRFRNDLNTRTQTQNFDSSYSSSNMALVLRQPLYRPVQYAGYQQAKVKLEGVEATLGKAAQDMAVRVARAYFNASLAEEGLSLVLAQQKSISTQLDAARKALTAGMGTRSDIDDAQARLDLVQAREISARQQIDQTVHELAILINRPVDKVAPLDPARLALQPMTPDALEPWTAQAEAASPELRALRAEVETARLEVDRARAGHLPTLDLVVQRTLNESDNVTNPNARYTNNQIGVQAAFPLYAGGYVSAQVRSASASLRESQERLEAGRRKLATEVRRQFQAVREGMAKVRAIEQAERSAEQAVLSSQKGLLAGTRTRLDILNAEQQLSQARLELTRERAGFVLARLQLLALTGELTVDAISATNAFLATGR